MNYQDWLNAVDKLLTEGGAGYTTEQIDRADLRGAFHQGVTPADYAAQGGHPISRTTVSIELTLPSPEHVAFLLKWLDRGGLFNIAAGILTLAFGTYQTYLFTASLLHELRLSESPGIDQVERMAFDNVIYYGIFTVFNGAGWAISGVTCWGLAALLRSANKGRIVQTTVPTQG